MYGWILQGTNLSPTEGKSRAGRWGKKGMRFGKGARERLPGCNAQLLTGQMGTASFFRQKESSMVDGFGQGSWDSPGPLTTQNRDASAVGLHRKKDRT